MGGIFGVASKHDCVLDLYYGTDYHSHLGTKRGGLAVKDESAFTRFIHNIENDQFRSKFETDIKYLHGKTGIGVISDNEDQPVLIHSHLGHYAIVTVGVIHNLEELAQSMFSKKSTHFAEMSGGEINPTEMVASQINQERSFKDGLQSALNSIRGSCSILVLTPSGIYAARDRLGRTPLIIGEKSGSFAVTTETCAFPNLGYSIKKFLGPGEVVYLSGEGVDEIIPPGEKLQICAFLWVYYGYPASSYENINVEEVRNRCGAELAKADSIKIDMVAGIPDSGIAHGLGYANEAGIVFKRPFVKYTPTWPRSFMPHTQEVRDLVAKMKLIPIEALIRDKKILFCEDSIVRGTQLKDTIQRLFDFGAKEVHMRPACPPLVYKCKFLNFSRSKSELDLAARKAIKRLEGDDPVDISRYAQNDSESYKAMIEEIRKILNLTTLKYQRLENMVKAIGLPKEKLCTYCWDGVEIV